MQVVGAKRGLGCLDMQVPDATGEVQVHALGDGRWIQINELRTSEGGIVGIYTDITEAKAEDARARARELAERNVVLQSTLDNLSEGVCVFDGSGQLAAWNDALRRLLALPENFAGALGSHAELQRWCRETLAMDDQGCLDWRGGGADQQAMVCLCTAGERHFELRSNAMADGGQVFGFTDVTDMLRAQASLQETAETLERRVSERTGELVDLNRKLEGEVAERRAIEAALIDAKIVAEKANLSKTRFLAAASHDLRQPLHALGLFLSELSQQPLGARSRQLTGRLTASTPVQTMASVSRTPAMADQIATSRTCMAGSEGGGGTTATERHGWKVMAT